MSFDLLFRGLEVTTGGQRIHDYQEQMDKLAARKMKAELFESFTILHKYGMPPHGGLEMCIRDRWRTGSRPVFFSFAFAFSSLVV